MPKKKISEIEDNAEEKENPEKNDENMEGKKENLEEKNDNIEENKENLGLKKNQNKQIFWAVFLMVLVILIIITTPFIVKNFINKFVYINLDFYKTMMGKITFYSTKVPITDKQMNIIADYDINLRNDPRKLDYIKVNVSENKVIFKKFMTVYVSLESNSPRCEDNLISVVGLTQFLKEFGNFTVKAAMDNKDYANETGYPYVTCSNYPTNTVIHLTSGNSSEIKKINDNCYELTYDNCRITPVTERFMLIILEDYMGYFKRY